MLGKAYRHPLQEHVVDVFVANDVFVSGGGGRSGDFGSRSWDGDADLSSSDHDADSRMRMSVERRQEEENCSVMIVTGANACGKSVYLKQAALIQFMAQIGSFVPAESALLGVVDKIFTRVSTRESVSKVQSSFMIDLNQVSLALRNATSRSLILVDEFGKGTLTEDGAGLFCGVIKHLLARKEKCPKVLAATHFHDIFNPQMLDPATRGVAFVNMQIMFATVQEIPTANSKPSTSPRSFEYNGKARQTSSDDSSVDATRTARPGEKITYLYRVAPGLSLRSHAAQCAELYGLPKPVVERAQYISELITVHEIGRLLDDEMTKEEKKDLEDAEAVFKRFLDWRLDEWSDEQVDVLGKLREILGDKAG